MGILELTAGAGVVAFLGMCKNAGKTTALNRMIKEYAAAGAGTLALTSIGRDGESLDLVTGTEKPPIYLYEGMLAATAEQLLPLADVSREILELPELYTSLGRVVLFRARSDGYVQLAGPAIVEQLAPLRSRFRALGADCLLIDGALSRRSPAAGLPRGEGCCVLSTGASLDRDLDRVVEETAFAARLLTLPELSDFSGEQPGTARFTLLWEGERLEFQETGALNAALKQRTRAAVLLGGALTERQASELLRGGGRLDGLTVIAEDGSRYLLKSGTFRRLEAMGVRFGVRKGTALAAVTVNPVSAGGWRFDRDEFLEKMSARSPAPVLDVGRYDGAEL